MRPLSHAAMREVISHYQAHLRLADKDVAVKFVGKIQPGPGEDRVYITTDDDEVNRHRFLLTVSRATLYLPTDRVIDLVCHELAHVLLWPLGCEGDDEHNVTERLAVLFASMVPRPAVLMRLMPGR